ncbi:MAG: type VI secretion system baseplate subunit TssG [Proteobacteria bacterium]|nr:type VI secretion system baseplate subunit TssG [Pseudomonadota bacterium]
MAPNDWSANASLNQINFAAEEYNFFQLTRLLEGLSSEVGDELRLNFAGHNSHATRPNFVEGILVSDDEEHVAVTVKTNGFHLFGQQGPLPQVFSELLARQTQAGNPGAAAFVDLFNNKILRALYDIKKNFSPMLFNGSQQDAQLFRLFEAISGVVDGSVFEQAMPEKFQRFWRQYAYLMGNRRVSYGLLKKLLGELLDAQVDVHPGTGSWRDLPASSQARLDKSVRLDASRCLGSRYWSHVNGLTIVLTFSSPDQYRAFLPGGEMHVQTVALIAVLTDLTLDVRLALRLHGGARPDAQLGGQLRLGQSSWLGGAGSASKQDAVCMLDRERLLGAMTGASSW